MRRLQPADLKVNLQGASQSHELILMVISIFESENSSYYNLFSVWIAFNKTIQLSKSETSTFKDRNLFTLLPFTYLQENNYYCLFAKPINWLRNEDL